MEIRRYRDDDVLQVGAVHAASRHAAYAGLVAPEALARVTPQTQAEAWRRRLTEGPNPWSMHVVVDPDDRRVAGFVLGSGPGPVATLHAIHVLPELHGSGAGQLLHNHIVAEFRAWSCSTAQLWVLEGNARAQAFYRRNGWALDGGRDTNDIGGALVPIVRYRRFGASRWRRGSSVRSLECDMPDTVPISSPGAVETKWDTPSQA